MGTWAWLGNNQVMRITLRSRQTCVMARSLAEGWNNQGVRHLRVPALLSILVSVLFFLTFFLETADRMQDPRVSENQKNKCGLNCAKHIA